MTFPNQFRVTVVIRQVRESLWFCLDINLNRLFTEEKCSVIIARLLPRQTHELLNYYPHLFVPPLIVGVLCKCATITLLHIYLSIHNKCPRAFHYPHYPHYHHHRLCLCRLVNRPPIMPSAVVAS